jgi:hypothetical protein
MYDKFVEFKNLSENQLNARIKTFRTDNGTEYLSERFKSLIKSSGIIHQLTNPYTAQQNGVSERLNRTIKDCARTILTESSLSVFYWPFAILYAVQTKNRVPHSSIDFKIPFELWFGKSPDYKTLLPFGCPVVYYDNHRSGVFKPAGEPGRFLGYAIHRKGYAILSSKSNKIMFSRDVTVLDDNELAFSAQADETVRLFTPSTLVPPREPSSSSLPVVDTSSVQREHEHLPLFEPDDVECQDASDSFPNSPLASSQTDPVPSVADDDATPISSPFDVPLPLPRFQFLSIHERDRLLAFNPGLRVRRLRGSESHELLPSGSRVRRRRHYICSIVLDNEINDLLSGPERESCVSAINDELKSLEDHNTWECVPIKPSIKLIRNLWVFRRKVENGQTRYKARLVAKGYTQKPGIDYFETSSPVIDISSVRFLLSFSCSHDMIVHHVDVKTAYLNAELKETIYMFPPRFISSHENPKLVCKLNKSIYGLKQSAKCWYDRLSAILLSFDLRPLINNSCIFANPSRSLLIGVYVDDLLIVAKDLNVANNFLRDFSQKIDICDKGPVAEFLGLEIQFAINSLSICQSRYINRLLDTFELRDANVAKTPISPGSFLDSELDESPLLTGPNSYASIVGSLLHLTNF